MLHKNLCHFRLGFHFFLINSNNLYCHPCTGHVQVAVDAGVKKTQCLLSRTLFLTQRYPSLHGAATVALSRPHTTPPELCTPDPSRLSTCSSNTAICANRCQKQSLQWRLLWFRYGFRVPEGPCAGAQGVGVELLERSGVGIGAW